jgi:signal transduction histidine kinase
MRQRRRSVPDYERALDDVSLETARLRALVESLLQLARSDGSDDLDMQDLDLSQLLGDVCASLAPLAESKGLTLRTDVPPGLVSHADADALIRLFVNVIDNAVKYTERGEIAVAARRTGKGLEVTVRDTGPGIPAAHLPHLFDRFFRGDASRSSEGSGLGLPIAQELAAVHGGTIVVASEERVGTICTVTLPGLAGNSRRWSARLQAT